LADEAGEVAGDGAEGGRPVAGEFGLGGDVLEDEVEDGAERRAPAPKAITVCRTSASSQRDWMRSKRAMKPPRGMGAPANRVRRMMTRGSFTEPDL